MQRSKQRNQGSALLSALFIMTLIAIAATAMSMRLQGDIYRTRLLILNDKLTLTSQLGTFWAMTALKKSDNAFLTADKTGRVAVFPKTLQNYASPFGITSALYDLQARLNVNNLTEKTWFAVFLKLLNKSRVHLPPKDQAQLLYSIYQWLIPYQPDRGQDHFINDYLKQTPPYYPANQPLQSLSELRLIHGVSAALYQALEPLLTALPETTPINLNTAPPAVLRALGRGLNNKAVEALVQARAESGIKRIETVSALLKASGITSGEITLESQYFLSITEVTSEDLTLTRYSVFKRIKNKKGKMEVSLLTERFNTV